MAVFNIVIIKRLEVGRDSPRSGRSGDRIPVEARFSASV